MTAQAHPDAQESQAARSAGNCPTPRLIRPKRFQDSRGWLCETYNERRLVDYGITCRFVQDNLSYSARTGTIRGLHFQAPPRAQAKLIRVVRGRVFDLAVDVRRGSPTYGRFVSVELSAANGLQFYIPIGFAHGFCTLDHEVEVVYKVSDFYDPLCECGIRWDDPVVAIPWPINPKEAILSDKDSRLPLLRECQSAFGYDGVPLAPLTPATPD